MVGVGLGLGVLLAYLMTGNVIVLWGGSVAVLVAGLALSVIGEARAVASPPELPVESPVQEWILWAIAIGCVVLVAVIQRYDHDTPFYVGLSVAAADFPARELMLDPIHGIPGLGLHQPAHRVHSIEIMSGMIAWVTRLPAFVATQAVTSSIAALLVPLAFARLFRVLTPRTWLGSVVVVLVVLIAAAGPNWYGNFSFVRMLHGKSVFVSVFLPLAWAYGLRFGQLPVARRFVLLCAVQVAAVGCTSSALWSVPIAAGLGVASGVPFGRASVRTLGLGLASSAYVVLVGATLISDMGGVAQTVEPSSFVGHQLRDAIAWTLPGTRLAAFAWASLLVAWALRDARAQRFAVVVPLVVLVLVLNPFFEEETRRYMTGPAYRRAMWVLPLPVLMTLLLTAPLRFAPGRLLGPGLVAVLCAAYVLFVPGHYGLSEANRVTLGAPGLKVHPREYPPALRLAAATPLRSTALAPQRIALWLPSFHEHPKILYAREPYLSRIRATLGPEEAETRMRLSEAVSTAVDIEKRTRRSDGFAHRRALGMTEPWFLERLRYYDVRAVSLNQKAPLAPRVRAALEKSGFEPFSSGGGYEEWVRDQPW
jgi:hypothetical protein